MLNLSVGLERDSYDFRDGVTEEAVTEYIKKIDSMHEQLKNGWDFKSYLFYSQELYDIVSKQIEQEKAYCNFYLAYLKRSKEEPNFNQWVLTQGLTEKNWRNDAVTTYDTWTLTNGKVKATLKIERTNPMVKLHLSFQNDSKSDLEFYSYYSNEKYQVNAHAKAEESVKAKIEELKKQAEQTLMLFQFPTSCKEKQQFDLFCGLLHSPNLLKEEAKTGA